MFSEGLPRSAGKPSGRARVGLCINRSRSAIEWHSVKKESLRRRASGPEPFQLPLDVVTKTCGSRHWVQHLAGRRRHVIRLNRVPFGARPDSCCRRDRSLHPAADFSITATSGSWNRSRLLAGRRRLFAGHPGPMCAKCKHPALTSLHFAHILVKGQEE